MIVETSSAHHIEVDFVDLDDIVRLCNAAGINADRVCKVSVIFVRGGLTDESWYEKLTERARAGLRAVDDQLDFTTP